MRLLLIEDDLMIASFVSKGLKEAGFVVEHASEGKTGLHMALTSCYDAAVIDIMCRGWMVSRSLTSYGSAASSCRSSS